MTAKPQKNFAAIAKKYAEDSQTADWAGKWTKLAGKRFIDDLQRKDLHFSSAHANRACRFVEMLPHVEGVWDKPTLVLHKSDVFFIVNLFGWRKPDGTRRFTTALKAIARKNAKSTIAAAIALYCQLKEKEVGPQVVSAATTGSQARIVFNIAKRMCEKTPALLEAFSVKPYANAIASIRNGGTFKPINAKASTQDGLNPSCVVLDEIHAHKDSDLLNVLRSAAGARLSPLFLFCTTEGYESPGPWHEIRHFAQQVLLGVVQADHFFATFYAIDDQDDDFDETKWVKANPLMESNPILMAEISKEAIEARIMPGKMAEFRIKRLNRQSATATGWIRFEEWQQCGGPAVDLEWLRQYPCYGGLDLASTSDLCAFRLVWYIDGVYYTWGRRWVPEEAVQLRTTRGTVPYAAWVEAGYVEQTPGKVIDHDVIKQAVLDASEGFDLKAVGYDQWNAAQVTASLEDAGIKMVMFIQGPKSYHPVMQEFERAYISDRFRYGTDPVLTWCAANIVARQDVNLNMAPDKKKSADKIDDMVALLMAIGTYITETAEADDEYDGGLTLL